jgi:hypothetical protein
VLLDGFREAISRWESASDQDGSEGFRALFEALSWAGSIQDRLEAENRDLPPTISGLYCVRNRVIHLGADVIAFIAAYGSGTYGSGTYGGIGFGFGLGSDVHRFPPRSELPPARSERGCDDYEKHVAERPVTDVLRRALAEADE